MKHIELGIERLLTDQVSALSGLKLGLVCNQASVDHSFKHAADLLHSGSNLRALFGPQHGIRVTFRIIWSKPATHRYPN